MWKLQPRPGRRSRISTRLRIRIEVWLVLESGDLDCPFLVLELLDFLVGHLQPRLGLVVVRVLGLDRIVDLVPALGTSVKVGKKD